MHIQQLLATSKAKLHHSTDMHKVTLISSTISRISADNPEEFRKSLKTHRKSSCRAMYKELTTSK